MINHNLNLNKKFGKLEVLGITKKSKYIYYDCICECGKYTTATTFSVLNGKSRSCGCAKPNFIKPRSDIKLDGASSFNYVYSTYKRNARKRNYPFELTKEQFKEIATSSCIYCGIKCNNSAGYHGKKNSVRFLYTGVDRLNNKLGYTLDNSVPCCKDCNIAKSTKTKEEFLSWVIRAYNFLLKEIK